MALGEDELYACYQRMEKPLYNVLYRWLWHAQDCQDLMHETFLRVWSRRERVDADRIDRLVWTTALNLARNRLRWRSLWRFAEPDADAVASDDPSTAAERAQRDNQLRMLLRRLPQRLRQVVLLSEFGGLDLQAIAGILGIPPGTVGSRKHEALKRLRAEFKEQFE